jgi:hypothetical protein
MKKAEFERRLSVNIHKYVMQVDDPNEFTV